MGSTQVKFLQISDVHLDSTLSGGRLQLPPAKAELRRNELREVLLDTLEPRTIRAAGLFRPQAVQRLIDDHLSGRCDNRKALFTLFMFQRWRSQWLDRAPETVAETSHEPALRAA